MACPNINLDSWKNLVAARGEDVAYYLWDRYEGVVPESESKSEIVKAGLKATNALQSEKGIQLFNTLQKNKVTGDAFWNKLQQDLQIPKEQIELLKQYNTTDREQLITNMLADYSFAIEIDITTQPNTGSEFIKVDGKYYRTNIDGEFLEEVTKEQAENERGNIPTQYYSNLTVPGGTNYTENEIATPAITPNIKGHAQFATDKGIGWFRSDDKLDNAKTAFELGADEYIEDDHGRRINPKNYTIAETGTVTKTRRILEVQSDLFQKGRDKDNLVSEIQDLKEPNPNNYNTQEEYEAAYAKFMSNSEIDTKPNQFLQLLNKGANWVTFFVKSIIQDSAKKGYEKVVFPTGPTAYKIESGGRTIEDFIKNKEDRLEELEEQKKEAIIPFEELEDWQKKVVKEEGGNFFRNDKSPEAIDREIDQVKKEIEDAKAGASGLAATARFYQENVANVLKKQGYNPKQVTDEYGNTWNEIAISPERESARILFQTEGMPSSKAAEETLNKVKEVAKKMGVDIQALTDYAKANPDIDLKSVAGVADLVKGVIAIANGREETALTEEMVHIATAILEQTNPKMITQMISKIDRFQIYKQTLEEYRNKKEYQLSDGKPDIRKIKKEAVDKLIAEVIINQNEGSTQFPELLKEENRSLVRKMWDLIMDIIKGMYSSSNINIFETAAEKIMNEEIGTIANVKGDGVFLQVKNDAVDKYYDKVIENDSKLKLNPKTATDKRHYTFDGKVVAKTVTEKVDENKNMPDRTGLDKQRDEQMAQWGDEGHKFLQNVFTNELLDENGYPKPVPTPVQIKTKLNENIQKHLREFALNVINSYADKPGTRFLIEKKVVNDKVKGMLASTVDFKAVVPDSETGIKIDTFDWKFANINKSKTDDVPWFKRRDWNAQMNEYNKMDLSSYGVKPNQIGKSRMIQFASNYNYQIPGDPTSPLVLNSLEIGKLDSTKETKLYLLPVPVATETTGNKDVDRLISSLRSHYDKLYKVLVSPEEKYLKNTQLNLLDKAIRSLHLKFDFGPLAAFGKTFLNNAAKAFKEFENLDYSKLTKEEISKKLQDLIEFKRSAEKFATLDDVFLSKFPKEGLDDEAKKILASIEQISSATGRMMDKINELQREFAIQQGLKLGMTKEEVVSAEKEINAFSKTFLEPSKLPSKIINIASNLIMNAKSLLNIKTARAMDDVSKLIIDLEAAAKSAGKKAFDMIGETTENGLSLIKKIDKSFWEKLRVAKDNKDLEFIKNNMDVEKYNKLAEEAIKKGVQDIENTTFSTDEADNATQRSYRITKLKDSLDINRKTFNGYDNYQFSYLFNKAMKEELHYSKEYREMAKNKAALDMWTYLTGLNERARQMGYLVDKGNSFFPLVEASAIDKLVQSGNILSQSVDFFKDIYSVNVNESQNYSKIDTETNQVKKEIPKLFTRTDKKVEQLSKDLTKVVSLWSRALLEYETNRDLEFSLLTLHSVEKAKGRLVTDRGELVLEGGVPKVDLEINKNANILESIIDDAIYGLRENNNSVGNVTLGKVTGKFGKDEESKEKRKINIKKGLSNADKLTQALAVGLKVLVAIPNYLGFHLQSFVNAGGMYKFGEFEKNNLLVSLPLGKGLTTMDKGLIDLFVPLNDDITKEKRRELAKKQSYIKYLGTWSFIDTMMISNSFPDKKLQLANAKSMIDNSMVVDGKIVNIRQHLRAKDRIRYTTMSQAQRRELEKSFEKRVSDLKESSSLSKVAKIENDQIVIPGVSDEELAKFRTTIVEYGRKLSGQMSQDNKADYRRDTILRSFMMFKNWIPKMVYTRAGELRKDMEIGEWEYGRARLFIKTWAHLGLRNVFQMRDIILGTDKGLQLMNEMLEAKRQEHFNKTGQELTITNEEFYDLVRKNLSNQMKELGALLSLFGLIVAARAAKPDDDDDELEKNRYKFWAKLVNKTTDELSFYYDPRSFISMTNGSVLPSLSLLDKVEKLTEHAIKQGYGYYSKDEQLMEKAHPTKYFLNLLPGLSQVQNDYLPYIDPELAKSLGVRVTEQSRMTR